jgi:hypothetical protein
MFLKGARTMKAKGHTMPLLLGSTCYATEKGIPDQGAFRNRLIDDLRFANCALTVQTASRQDQRHGQPANPRLPGMKTAITGHFIFRRLTSGQSYC